MALLDDTQQKSLNAVLYDAVIGGNLDRTKLCLSRGAQAGKSDMKSYFDGRGTGVTPLACLAYENYNREVLDALAQGGLDIDEKDSRGKTALAYAVSGQRLDCVRHFLALGANPLAELDGSRTVMDLARENQGYSGLVTRDSIIDALVTAVPLPGEFNASAKKPEAAVSTVEAITVNKPISLTPHKKEGFQL
jgi:hypothetical protein